MSFATILAIKMVSDEQSYELIKTLLYGSLDMPLLTSCRAFLTDSSIIRQFIAGFESKGLKNALRPWNIKHISLAHYLIINSSHTGKGIFSLD